MVVRHDVRDPASVGGAGERDDHGGHGLEEGDGYLAGDGHVHRILGIVWEVVDYIGVGRCAFSGVDLVADIVGEGSEGEVCADAGCVLRDVLAPLILV